MFPFTKSFLPAANSSKRASHIVFRTVFFSFPFECYLLPFTSPAYQSQSSFSPTIDFFKVFSKSLQRLFKDFFKGLLCKAQVSL